MWSTHGFATVCTVGVVVYSLAGAFAGVVIVLAIDRVRRRLDRRQARTLRHQQAAEALAAREPAEPSPH